MKRVALTTIFAGLFAVSSFAQVNQRRENQQDRVAQGVQSGQLTPGETANIENRERGINGEIRADKNADGGKLTAAERQQINRQQNGVSRQIYKDKHNAAQDHFGNSEVGRREENQQDRIAQGIKSGHLNAGETANLENRERAINGEVRADRRANGGKLTGSERARVNRQQNRTSRAIYRAKH
jgi:metal-dependent amidase/aminoacylase/carboxypeptidase family protein